jgi:hypothetical protein
MSTNPHHGSLSRSSRRKRSNAKNPHSANGSFVMLELEMLTSPAYIALLKHRAAFTLLNRLMVEHMQHAGKTNGRLKVTYKDFEGYGVGPNSVADAIAINECLGFVRVTKRGRASFEDQRYPSEYALTFRAIDNDPPTHNWRRFPSDIEAQAALKVSIERRRLEKAGNRHRNRKRSERPKQIIMGPKNRKPPSAVRVAIPSVARVQDSGEKLVILANESETGHSPHPS